MATTLLLLSSSFGDATSIIVAFRPHRIVVFADSRVRTTNSKGDAVHDDMCKIMTLGTEFAFAETGREGYRRDDPLDPVPEWPSVVWLIPDKEKKRANGTTNMLLVFIYKNLGEVINSSL